MSDREDAEEATLTNRTDSLMRLGIRGGTYTTSSNVSDF